MNKRTVYESVSGPIILDAMKAAYLPTSKTLLVADLHFEKGSYLQMAGNAVLPAYDTTETVTRLKHVIDVYRPAHVVALGDSFHDVEAGDRISQTDVTNLNKIISELPNFTWILGNHDPDIPSALNGHQEDHLDIDGFFLTHLPMDSGTEQTNICGHLHPKARLTVSRRHISHPCFACSDTRIILPSFGAYTGGLYTSDPAIDSIMGGDRLFAMTTPSGIFPLKSMR